MPIEVLHRGDILIPRRSDYDGEAVADMGSNAYQKKYGLPLHAMLYVFMEQHLVNKTFADMHELAAVLETWKTFLEKGGVSLLEEDTVIRVTEMTRGELALACGESPGGSFCFALLKTVEEANVEED